MQHDEQRVRDDARRLTETANCLLRAIDSPDPLVQARGLAIFASVIGAEADQAARTMLAKEFLRLAAELDADLVGVRSWH